MQCLISDVDGAKNDILQLPKSFESALEKVGIFIVDVVF